MIHHDFVDRYLCSIDPLKLFGLGGGSSTTPAQAAPTAPPTFMAQPVAQPTGQKPTAKPSTPTFLGMGAAPPVQSGQKTLLGQ